MFEFRRSEARGQANFGWLQSRHSFSFGRYYDANHMGFSALRVINDDIVAGGGGFDTHSHQHMEIISLVTQGEMAHRDSAGHVQRLPAGEYQLMSAGRGIAHSEFNVSPTAPLRFLQIWIQPKVFGTAPSYQQQAFDHQARNIDGLTLIASPDGALQSMTILQDMRLYQLQSSTTQRAGKLQLDPQRHYYLHLIRGQLAVQAQLVTPDNSGSDDSQADQAQAEASTPKGILYPGDGLKISGAQLLQWQVHLNANSHTHNHDERVATAAAQSANMTPSEDIQALWFDLP